MAISRGLALNVVSLHQDRVPGQSGYEGLKFNWMLENWSQVVDGVRGMVEFVEGRDDLRWCAPAQRIRRLR
jgi:hypothetical protein